MLNFQLFNLKMIGLSVKTWLTIVHFWELELKLDHHWGLDLKLDLKTSALPFEDFNKVSHWKLHTASNQIMFSQAIRRVLSFNVCHLRPIANTGFSGIPQVLGSMLGSVCVCVCVLNIPCLSFLCKLFVLMGYLEYLMCRPLETALCTFLLVTTQWLK